MHEASSASESNVPSDSVGPQWDLQTLLDSLDTSVRMGRISQENHERQRAALLREWELGPAHDDVHDASAARGSAVSEQEHAAATARPLQTQGTGSGMTLGVGGFGWRPN